MTADAKLLADMDALVAYMTDKTGKMPMPEVCDIPGTMRRAAGVLQRNRPLRRAVAAEPHRGRPHRARRRR
jgi:hypothetical protein